jgi:hypothetical protein
MKAAILTFIIAGLMSTAANGQQKKVEGPMPNVPLFKTPSKGYNFRYKIPGDSSTHFYQAIPPGVYNLRQDNMPCIVPDLTATNPIPNAFPVTIPFVGRIPNAAPEAKQR